MILLTVLTASFNSRGNILLEILTMRNGREMSKETETVENSAADEFSKSEREKFQ